MKPRPQALIGQMGDVDLRLLRVFRAVVNCGGMAAAELELNIGISTISRHVKDLEDRLGLVLCRRGRGGFALTPEGERVHAAATNLLEATDTFRHNLHDIHREIGGDVHLALFENSASNPASRIADALARFRYDAPEVTLHVHIGTIGMIERGVLAGRYHLGVIPEHRRSASLAYDELFDERMLLYAGSGHAWARAPKSRRDWKALASQPLAGLDYHSPNLELTRQRNLKRSAHASDQEGVALLILSSAFVGFLPDHYAEAFVRTGRMAAVAPDVLNYRCTFSCIYRRDPPPLRVAEVLRHCLVGAHS